MSFNDLVMGMGIKEEWLPYLNGREHIVLERADATNDFSRLDDLIKEDKEKRIAFYDFHVGMTPFQWKNYATWRASVQPE